MTHVLDARILPYLEAKLQKHAGKTKFMQKLEITE